MEALLDNDLLYKLTRYGLLHEFERLLVIWGYGPPHKRIASAPWSLRTVRGKITPDRWPDPAEAETLRQFLFARSSAATGAAAAALTALAVPAFDAGEVQLVAYAMEHPQSRIMTGDKRAIRALCHEPALAAAKAAVGGRIIHLNSVIYALSKRLGWHRIAVAVAAAPVDCELTAIYALANENAIHAALRASIATLEAEAPGILAP